MLSALPVVEGLTLAARYVPADARERVGGDWYDAVLLSGAGPGDQALAVTVGDIIGHTMHAATIMGQVRSMMRQAGWERDAGRPARWSPRSRRPAWASGSTRPARRCTPASSGSPTGPDDGRWSGRTPAIRRRYWCTRTARPTCSTEHDMLFGFPHLMRRSRTDHRMVLEPGSTVVLHTDGLIESRRSDIDQGTDALRALLTRHHGLAPQELVDTVVTSMVGDQPDDDVVAMAVRLG